MEQTSTITLRNKTYKVLPQKSTIQTAEWHVEQINYAIEIGDWNTVQNRINNGLTNGWIVEVPND